MISPEAIVPVLGTLWIEQLLTPPFLGPYTLDQITILDLSNNNRGKMGLASIVEILAAQLPSLRREF